MDKNLGYILLAGVAAFFLLGNVGKYGSKSFLAKLIIAKYGNPQSPDYRPLFDSSYEGLMKLDYETLSQIYEGKIN